jgi:hypothetical protein
MLRRSGQSWKGVDRNRPLEQRGRKLCVVRVVDRGEATAIEAEGGGLRGAGCKARGKDCVSREGHRVKY